MTFHTNVLPAGARYPLNDTSSTTERYADPTAGFNLEGDKGEVAFDIENNGVWWMSVLQAKSTAGCMHVLCMYDGFQVRWMSLSKHLTYSSSCDFIATLTEHSQAPRHPVKGKIRKFLLTIP